MARPGSDARERVLSVAVRHVKRGGISGITLDAIADETGCAKGLVTYHFGSKDKLIHAATEGILLGHRSQWEQALSSSSFENVIRQTWQTLLAEVKDGYWRAWLSLSVSRDRVIGQLVSNHISRFADTLRSATESQIRTMGLEPTVSSSELGHFLVAGLSGIGLQLSSGVKQEVLEGAHSAMWVAVLGMTRPNKARA